MLTVVHTVFVRGLYPNGEDSLVPADFRSLNTEDGVVYPVEATGDELLRLDLLEGLFDPPNTNVDVDIGLENDSLRNGTLMSSVSKLALGTPQGALTAERDDIQLEEVRALERPSKVHLVVTLTTTSTTYVEETRPLDAVEAETTVTVTSTEIEQSTLLLSMSLSVSSQFDDVPEVPLQEAPILHNSESQLVPLTANGIREIFKETLLSLKDEISKKFANNGNRDDRDEVPPDPLPQPTLTDEPTPGESEQLDVNDIHSFIKELIRTVNNNVPQSIIEDNGLSAPALEEPPASTLQEDSELVDEIEQNQNLIELYGLGDRDLKEIEKYEKFLSLSRFKDLPEDIITDIIDFVRAKDKHQFIDNFRHRPFLKGIAIDVTSTDGGSPSDDDDSKGDDDDGINGISDFEEIQQDSPPVSSEQELNANGLLSSILESQISSKEGTSRKKASGKKKKLKKPPSSLMGSLEQRAIPNRLKAEDRDHTDEGFTSLDQKFTTKFNRNKKKVLKSKKKAPPIYDNVDAEEQQDDFYNPEAELFDGFPKQANKEGRHGMTSGTNHNIHFERNNIKALAVEESIDSHNVDITEVEPPSQLANGTVSDATTSTSPHPSQPTREALEDPSLEESYSLEGNTGRSDNHHKYMGVLQREQLETNAKAKLKQRDSIMRNPSLLFDKANSGSNRGKTPNVGGHYKGEFFDFTSKSTNLRAGVLHHVGLILCSFTLLFFLLA